MKIANGIETPMHETDFIYCGQALGKIIENILQLDSTIKVLIMNKEIAVNNGVIK